MGRGADRAQRKLAEATEQVASWKRREEQLASELAAAEANVGAEALESGDLEGAAAKVSNLRDQVEAARRTVAAAEATRDVAQRDAWLAEAASRRAEGDRLDKEADKHAARTRELMDALKDHEGGTYVPEQPQVGVASSIQLLDAADRAAAPPSDRRPQGRG